MAKLKVRIVPPAFDKASHAGSGRVEVSLDTLYKLAGADHNNNNAGRLCLIERISAPPSDANDGSPPAMLKRHACLWGKRQVRGQGDKIGDTHVVMSRAFHDACGFSLKDEIQLTLVGDVPDAQRVVVRECEMKEGGELDEGVFAHWEFALGDYLERAVEVYPGMVFEGVCLGRQRRSFRVVTVDESTTSLARYSRTTTRVQILSSSQQLQGTTTPSSSSTLTPTPAANLILDNIPGHTRPVALLNDFLSAFSRPFLFPRERTSVAAVIHGAHGTGKSFLLDRIASLKWGPVFRVKPADKSASIREVFKLAKAQRPAVILLDDLHRIVRKDRAGYDVVMEVLEDELDALAAEITDSLPKVLVLASCLDYMEDVPHDLAKQGRFEENIMLAVPSADERLDILRSMDVPLPDDVRETQLSELARRAHAYNPRDLQRLVHKAIRLAVVRLGPGATAISSESPPTVSLADLEAALPTTRPSTMAGINLKPPVVRWGDIGGQDDVKRALKRMVRLTTTAASDPTLRSLVVTLPKGMLLYGPPGCSKTLSAQAFATESGFNFFSVKGAELLNMYVGESERAMRNLFARAAAASPSIIFFDEIDSIAGQRGPGAGGGAAGAGGNGARAQSAVNLITTLLTEMDGFETLTGVLILAATNRPEAMDPALLRPGRFDQVVYVGPPDLATREAVFRVYLRRCALADDVDFAELARTTDGHSGANIKHICAEAGLAVLHRVMEEGAEHASIAMADLNEAIERTPRLITKEMVDGYEKWQKRFRPCK